MNKEIMKRVCSALVGVIGLLCIVVGTSYALFSSSFKGTKVNKIKSSCLMVKMSDEGPLSIMNALPVTDDEALMGNSYAFSIANTCTAEANYTVTLNVMKGSNLDNISKTKVALDGDLTVPPIMESNLEETYLLDTKIKNVEKTYKLATDIISPGESRHFRLYSWIDYDVEDISGYLENKVIINSTTNN